MKTKLLEAFGVQRNQELATNEVPPQVGSASSQRPTVPYVDTPARQSESKGKGKARAEDIALHQTESHTSSTPINAEKTKRQEEIRQRRKEAEKERQRVLDQIEYDKQARKERERERKAAAQPEVTSQHEDTRTTRSRQTFSKECALKVRTFDGSTISATFPSDQSLRVDVRPWVESSLGPLDSPYEFKQVLVPLPNRRIETSEEEETLQALGLAPTATLVMVPVESYSTAYNQNQGYVSAGLSYGYGMVSSGFGLVGSLFRSILGGTPSASAGESSRGSNTYDGARDDPRSSSIRIRTLEDQRRPKDDQQLYNGNQVSEPIDVEAGCSCIAA